MSFPLRDTQIRMSQCPSYRSNQLRAGHPRRPRRRMSARGMHTVAQTGRARSASLNIAIGASHPPLNARASTQRTHGHTRTRTCIDFPWMRWVYASGVCRDKYSSSADILPATCCPSAFAQVDMQHFCEPRRCDGRLRMRMHFVCECVRTRLPSHARRRQPQVAYALPLGR